MPIHRKERATCPVELTINVFAARWKARIIYQLLCTSELNFKQLRLNLDGISHQVLITQLDDLQSNQILSSRRMGRSVLYSLTTAGRELRPIFEAMGRWGATQMG